MISDKNKNILILNCGSSSLKYKIISMPEEKELVCGEAERVGIKTQGVSLIRHNVKGKARKVELQLSDHSAALKKVLELIGQDAKNDKEIRFDVFAHRYVHPGTFFKKTEKVTGSVLNTLKKTLPFAPIHNPVAYGLIEFCYRQYPQINQFVVFDTSFHRTIPPEFSTYALPLSVIKKYKIRKIGFHGISHRYAMQEACRFLGRKHTELKMISCHLGTGGSSICAINAGKSVNNSMGFTPLEGLIMNTRCGDVDPGAVFYLMSRERFSPEETEMILNKKSGILGVFNRSSDLRDVMRDMGPDTQARMTFEMYVRRVRTYIAFYSLILKKADVLLFTDSLGVQSAELRGSICRDMEFLGIFPDKVKNEAYRKGIEDVSLSGSGTRILVIPADEEIMIAREALKEMRI